MYPRAIITDPASYPNLPVIDKEFDHFEENNDLWSTLHEAETSTFYHDGATPDSEIQSPPLQPPLKERTA